MDNNIRFLVTFKARQNRVQIRDFYHEQTMSQDFTHFDLGLTKIDHQNFEYRNVIEIAQGISKVMKKGKRK